MSDPASAMQLVQLASAMNIAGAYLVAISDIHGPITVLVGKAPTFTVFIGPDVTTARMGVGESITDAVIQAMFAAGPGTP